MSAMPNRDRKAERREATRREIVDAAWDVARDEGLEGVTLRAVAERVGMRSPSLYTHFESKNAIYDSMYGQAWADYLSIVEAEEGRLPKAPRKKLQAMLRTFYAPSVRVMEIFLARLREIGITDREDADLLVALIAGLIDVRFANDPSGDRYIRQHDRAIDMIADEFGLPGPRTRSRR
jgi:AcrR family transcriptional regulator